MVETKQKENQCEDKLIWHKEQTMLNQDAFNSEGPIPPYWDHVESHFEDVYELYLQIGWPRNRWSYSPNFEKNNGIVLVLNKWHFPQSNVILHEPATNTQMTNHSTYKMYIEWDH